MVNYTVNREALRVIRRAELEELPLLYEICRKARDYMVKTGNPTQWGPNYPEVYLQEDIEREHLYVLTDGRDRPHALFAFVLGEEPSYRVIRGAWLNDKPYGTIHRIASDGEIKGVFIQTLAFCRAICPDIRADTHENNGTMRHLLEKSGFIQCGYINLDKQEGDTLRVAYQL